jgi:uncharacterized protein (TIGR02996 family)
MAAEDGFLADILSQPDDLTPRLVYADWLDEHGQSERAEFIRVQIELTQVEEHSSRWRQLSAREYKLIKAHKKAWGEPFRGLAPHYRFYRGFVEQVSMYAGSFVKKGARLFELAPVRTAHLSLSSGSGVFPVADLSASPLLARLASLDLSGNYDLRDPGVVTLSACPHLTRLRALNLERCPIGREGLQALAASPHLGVLEELNLGVNALTLPGSRRCELSLEGLRSLARSASLTRLTHLNLAGAAMKEGLGRPLLEVFRDAPAWEGLRELNLSRQALDDEALTVLAGLPGLGRLRALDLQGNPLGDGAAETLAGSPHLAGLERIHLVGCREVGDPGIRALAGSKYLKRLRSLAFGQQDLYGLRFVQGRITDAGAQSLAAAPSLAGLRYLDLSSNQIGDEGAQAIAASPYLGGLGHLNLKGNRISKETEKALRKRYGPGVCTFSQS